MYMAPKYTHSTQEALQGAQTEPIRGENQELQPEHLLNALVSTEDQDRAMVANILQLAGVNLPSFKNRLKQLLERLPKVSGGSGQIYASAYFNRLLVLAEDEAKKMEDEY